MSLTPELSSLMAGVKRVYRALAEHAVDCVLCQIAMDRYRLGGELTDFPPCDPVGVRMFERCVRATLVARYYELGERLMSKPPPPISCAVCPRPSTVPVQCLRCHWNKSLCAVHANEPVAGYMNFAEKLLALHDAVCPAAGRSRAF